jgi:hypothetical protein
MDWSASLNRPGGNITGVTFLNNLLSSKRLELLHELVPGAQVIAVLLNPDNPNAELEREEVQVAARAIGLQILVFRERNEREFDAAFASLVEQKAAALYHWRCVLGQPERTDRLYGVAPWTSDIAFLARERGGRRPHELWREPDRFGASVWCLRRPRSEG